MKDKNGIEIKCESCANYGTYLFMPCLLCLAKRAGFKPTKEAYEARIVELQEQLKMSKQSTDCKHMSKNGEKSTESVNNGRNNN